MTVFNMRVAVDLNRKRVMILQSSENSVMEAGQPSWLALQSQVGGEKKRG